jgi:hypothetical protein
MNQGNSLSNGTIILYSDISISSKKSGESKNPCTIQNKKAFEIAMQHLSKII